MKYRKNKVSLHASSSVLPALISSARPITQLARKWKNTKQNSFSSQKPYYHVNHNYWLVWHHGSCNRCYNLCVCQAHFQNLLHHRHGLVASTKEYPFCCHMSRLVKIGGEGSLALLDFQQHRVQFGELRHKVYRNHILWGLNFSCYGWPSRTSYLFYLRIVEKMVRWTPCRVHVPQHCRSSYCLFANVILFRKSFYCRGGWSRSCVYLYFLCVSSLLLVLFRV